MFTYWLAQTIISQTILLTNKIYICRELHMQWYTIQYATKTRRVASLVDHTETKQNKSTNKAKTKQNQQAEK